MRVVSGLLGALLLLGAGVVSPVTARQQTSADAEATIAALQTQVAQLEGDGAGGSPTPTVAGGQTDGVNGEEGDGAAAAAVNLEIILDVSGSMAQLLDTGETRMDAAKRTLAGVVDAIPEREGINVGLRVYGHLGDNTEAGAAVSCVGSDLVVPVSGVDKAAIRAEIDALVPTGWTPIALSLDRAAEDFPAGEPPATNAIVLVTDGLETCGGDPARAAGRLFESDGAIVTNVIGFALSGEEQQQLAGIAEAGHGQLLGAANADELNAALFDVLEELEIVAGRGAVGGNAFSLIPVGESGVVSVVAHGGPESFFGGSLPFVVRNNTSGDVADVSVTATVRDASGALVASAESLNFYPSTVVSGGVGFGDLFFGSADIVFPADAVFEFAVDSTPVEDVRFEYRRDLEVDEAALLDGRIVTVLRNGLDEPVSGPVLAGGVCFDYDGRITGSGIDSNNLNRLAESQTVSLQIAPFVVQFQGAPCPAFLVAGYGSKE